jgi:hypothetical protein
VESELPKELRAFISRHVASLEALEVLLLLFEQRERDWTAAEINAQLRSQESSIAKWLRALVGSGLAVAVGPRHRFAARDAQIAELVRALAEAYRTRRTKVIEFIFSQPNENLLSFVRAFDLRTKP